MTEKLQYFKAQVTFYVIHKSTTIDALDVGYVLTESWIPYMLSAITKSQIRTNSNDRINVSGLIKTTMLDRKPKNVSFPSFDMTIPKEK